MTESEAHRDADDKGYKINAGEEASRSHIITEKNTQSAQQAADNLKDAARRIRETSNAIRDTVRTIRESGAIDELASGPP